MFVPELGLIKPGQTCLSSTMGFLHENITLAYFVFSGDQSSALSLTVGFSELLAFAQYLWAFSVGQGRHTSQRFSTLVAIRRQISEGNILCRSSLNLTDKRYNGDTQEILE